MIKEESSIPAKAPGYSPPHLDERTPRKTLTVVNAEGELEEVCKIQICRTAILNLRLKKNLMVFFYFQIFLLKMELCI